jgi:hypothetical protein
VTLQLDRIEMALHGIVENQRVTMEVLDKILVEMQRPPSREVFMALERIFLALEAMPKAVAAEVISEQGRW